MVAPALLFDPHLTHSACRCGCSDDSDDSHVRSYEEVRPPSPISALDLSGLDVCFRHRGHCLPDALQVLRLMDHFLLAMVLQGYRNHLAVSKILSQFRYSPPPI